MGTQNKPHAIIFPLPYQGHIPPSLNLAIKLASRGYAITFVLFEFAHHKLVQANCKSIKDDQVDFFSNARKSGLDIRCATIADGFPPDFDRDNFFVAWKSYLTDFPPLMEEFVGKIIREADTSLVSFLIADTFFPCSSEIAKKYNLVHVSLFTQPALVFTIGYHLDLLAEKGHFPCQEIEEEEINYIPGIESIKAKDLISYIKAAQAGTLTYEYGTATFNEVKKADIILHNTIQELESKALESLSNIKPTYAIGPILSFTDPPKIAIPKSLLYESDCTEWLDSRPPGSVLYVSLGSIVPTSAEELQELAQGLLLSEVNFIWVLRENLLKLYNSEILSVGFKDEIKERGLIVPWCNQIMVLSHPAVGGFLTHCGFNSTLESMWCGVPMICCPIMFDQPIIRKLVVDDWKGGINLVDGTSINREDVTQKIKSLISGDSSKGLRQQANQLKNIMRNALENNGSSQRNFDQFITDLEVRIFHSK